VINVKNFLLEVQPVSNFCYQSGVLLSKWCILLFSKHLILSSVPHKECKPS